MNKKLNITPFNKLILLKQKNVKLKNLKCVLGNYVKIILSTKITKWK